MNDDYNVAVQMINKFNAQPHFGDVQIGLDRGDYGLLYNAVITMQTTEVKSRAFKDEVEVEREIYSKIEKLQSGLPGALPPGSFLTDVRVTKGYGLEHDDPDTITIYIYPKQGTEGIEGLKSFLSLVSSISQEITGGDIAQRELPGIKENMKITKEELQQIIKEELSHVINENVNADIIRRLANDKVLYYHAKGSVDDYMGEEISDEAFVDIIDNLPMQPTGDTVDNIVKDATWNWLGNEEVFQSMGRERTLALAADGMKQWGQKQVELGSYDDRLARFDAGTHRRMRRRGRQIKHGIPPHE